MEMKTIKFKHSLVKLILDGSKTTTWRLFDDKDIEVSDKLEFVEKESGKKFAKAEVVEVKEKKLREVEVADFEGHESYENEEEMLRQYRIYYGDKVTGETVVKIIRFELL